MLSLIGYALIAIFTMIASCIVACTAFLFYLDRENAHVWKAVLRFVFTFFLLRLCYGHR